jgi:lipid-A-disaccharide synthase-like uncharacterized protein
MWIAFGLTGQLLFTARFVVQWLRSEQQKKSVIPHAFWYFSIGGGIILLTYAIYRQDIVFMIGQASGLFIYLRNIQLIRKESGRLRIAEPTSSDNNASPASSVRKVS